MKQKQQQRKFHDLVAELMDEEDSDLTTYQSVVGMVYSLIENGQLLKLYDIIKREFPDYYSSQQNNERDFNSGNDDLSLF